MSDYVVGLSDTAFTALEYSSRINGFKSLDEMFNTDVFAFTSKTDETGTQDYGYLIPRRHTAISFEESESGKVFNFEVTRIAQTQSSIMEISAFAEVLASGFTQVDIDGQTVDVTLPLIAQFRLGSEPEEVIEEEPEV